MKSLRTLFCVVTVLAMAVCGLPCVALSLESTVAAVGTSCSWTRLSGTFSRSNGNQHVLQAAFATGEDSEVETVILASEKDPAAAAAACGLAGARKAPIVMTSATKLTADAKYELTQYMPLNVLMVGFSNASARASIKKAVSSALGDVDPLVNANLYSNSSADTAAKLYTSYGPDNAMENYFKDSSTAIVASAEDFDSIVSVGAYAYATKSPVFLCSESSLGSATVSVLKSGEFSSAIVVGDATAVGSSVEAKIASLVSTGQVQRWDATGSACAVSAALAQRQLETGALGLSKMALVSASDADDAITGATACGENKALMLLAGDSSADWDASVGEIVEPNTASIGQGYILGTRSSLSDNFAEKLRRIGTEQNAANLYYATVSLSQTSYEYTGSGIKPTLTVTKCDGTVAPASSYLVKYYDSATDVSCTPKEPGSYTVTVNGITADCTNSCSATFTITGSGSGSSSGSVAVYKTLNAKAAALSKVKFAASGSVKISAKYQGKAVTTVCAKALKGCSKLTGVQLASAKLTTIGAKAFYGCKSLKLLVIKSSKITSVGKAAFKGVNASCKVKVPASCVKKYAKLFKKAGLSAKTKVVKG